MGGEQQGTLKLGLIAGIATVAVLLGVGGWALSREGILSCPKITIAASPDIAPSLQRIAASYNEQSEGSCTEVTVKAAEPDGIARALAESETASPGTLPNVWVPDSSLWLNQARSTPYGAYITPDHAASVATSAVVLAAAEPQARKLGWPNLRVTWAQALQQPRGQRLRVMLPDPTRNAVGLAALMAAQPTTVNSPQGRDAYVALLRSLAARTAPRVVDLVRQVTRTTAPAGRSSQVVAFPASEQMVWQHNSGNSTALRLAAIYPSDGTLSLDYPYVVIGRDEDRVAAAEAFRRYLITTEARRSLLRAGFRGPDGVPGPQLSRDKGVDPTLPKPVPTPTDTGSFALRMWTTVNTDLRMLTVFDVSGSMAEQVPGTNATRMQVTTQAAQQALGLLSDRSEVGLWTFSTHLNGTEDYARHVDPGPLAEPLDGGVTRRAVLSQTLLQLRPKPDGGTGLYDTTLAAYRAMKETYDPTKLNSVVVFTDGANDDDQGISLEELKNALRKEWDPTQPVVLIYVAFGPDTDPATLKSIAEITRGSVFTANSADEITRVFLESLLKRACAAQC